MGDAGRCPGCDCGQRRATKTSIDKRRPRSRRTSACSRGGLILLNHARGDAPAGTDRDTLFLRPGPDGGATLAAHRSPHHPAARASPAAVFDERRQLLPERCGVLLVQVNLVLCAADPEPHRLICWAPVEIITGALTAACAFSRKAATDTYAARPTAPWPNSRDRHTASEGLAAAQQCSRYVADRVTRPMSPLAARDGQILALWPTEMPIHTSLRRNVPHFGAPSRQRTANKRSKGPVAVWQSGL